MRQSENAAKILNEKKEEGEAVLYGLRHAQQTSEAAERQAQLAYNKANQAMNVSTAEVTRVTEVQRSIDEFQRNSTITPGTTCFVDRHLALRRKRTCPSYRPDFLKRESVENQICLVPCSK